MASKLLNQYQAAALVCMSPELLRHLATHQVKWKDKRRLAFAKEVDGVLFFEESELRAYDDWLKAPWPAKDDKRPTLPDAIREEIRLEANLECALCKSSGEAGEAAHIDPVHTSRSNHPHNLIWLCATHHTKFDNGCVGPKGSDNKFIAGLKLALQHFKRAAWLGQAEVGRQIAATLSLCGAMRKHLESAATEVEVEAVEQIAKKALALLPKLASQSKAVDVQPTLKRMSVELAAGKAKTGTSTKDQLVTAASYEREFLKKSGLIRCPLCKGSKTHNGYDCPVCAGDGAVHKDLEVDLADFELIDCQLCKGTGRHNWDHCPACDGEGQLEQRISDRVDFSLYDLVRCPLCKGKRRWQGEDCPECGAEGKLPLGAAERMDLTKYEDVDCPLCKGAGSYEGDTCPECHGDQKMPRRYADQVEVSKYELQCCPLCKGKGSFMDGECLECGGNGRMPIGAAELVDLSQYDMVKCPSCHGKGAVDGYDCRVCDGNKRILRMHADRL